jgi:nitrate reductase (cytochrome), electron transfer subunit
VSGRHGLEIGAAVVLAVAAVGLVSGVESSGRTVASYIEQRPARATTVVSRSYRDLRAHATGPNAQLPDAWWQSIQLRDALPTVEPAPATPAERAAARAHRAERRAYDGAPPTIPHAVDQLATPGCLACHERGVRLAGLVAPRMSHDHHDSCLQCHVVARDPRRGVTAPPPPATTFVAAELPRHGERAWPGAPPTIPHPTAMRGRCDSCHGPNGAVGLRSPHPWRASCTQCHAASAVLEQRAPVARGVAP